MCMVEIEVRYFCSLPINLNFLACLPCSCEEVEVVNMEWISRNESDASVQHKLVYCSSDGI